MFCKVNVFKLIKCMSLILAVSLCLNVIACNNYEKNKVINSEGDTKPLLFDEISFGRYEQDGNENDGREDIIWQVIDENNDSMLLISKFILDMLFYDDKTHVDDGDKGCTWETSYLREYLNDSFYNSAFNDNEKSRIVLSYITNGKVYGINNSDIPVDIGEDTKDKVYILSKDEIRKYLGYELNGRSDNYIAKPSEFSKLWYEVDKDFAIWYKEREYNRKYDNYVEYWVRSNGELSDVTDYEYTALIVTKDGHIENRRYPYCVCKYDDTMDDNYEVKYYKRGVRPVIRIKKDNKTNIINQVSVVDKASINAQKYDVEDLSLIKFVSNYDKTCAIEDFDTILFGRYEQDNNQYNGLESIEWIALDRKDDKVLVVSKYILEYVGFSNVYDKRVTWYNSSLRAYVNNEFYNTAFNEREKVYITPTKVKTYDNPVYNSIEEKETIDRINILGFDECMEYFDIDYDECIKNRKYEKNIVENNKLKTKPTLYAREKFYSDKDKYKGTNESDFWLRNEGYSGEENAYKYNSSMSARETVDFKGSIYDLYMVENGYTIKKNLKLGLRPMMWIDASIIN